MKKKRKKSNLKFILLMIFVPLITFFGTIFVYDKFFNNTIPSVEDLKEEKKKDNYSDKDDSKDVSNYVNELPNLRVQYNNNDILGKLEITPLNINTMVMRSVNNSYYLDRNVYKQVDGLGVPFFDYRNQSLATNRQINIYGHNTQNVNFISQLPFVNLTAYTDKNIFDNYKKVYLSIDEKQVEYEVIAVKIITDSSNNEHMKLIFYSDEDFVNHAAKMINGSLYTSNATVTKDDRLLVLQVCYYDPPGSYLIVICKEKK